MVTRLHNWLITGGCGFIGTSLIKRLLAEQTGLCIRVVDNLSAATLADLERVAPVRVVQGLPGPMGEPGVELVRADIRDREAALRSAAGAETIVHLAANTGVQPSIKDPVMDMECNVAGVVNYLEAARHNGTNSFVFASSSAPIGYAEPPITEEKVCRPISPYGASKLAGEAYLSAYHESYALKTVALRFSNVYGPLSVRKGSVVALFIRQALAGEAWTFNGDGKQTRDFIHVDDIVSALIAAACSPHGGELYQISTGVETAVSDMADMLAKILKDQGGIETSIRFAPPLTADVRRSWADITKARTRLGWEPKRELREGLVETVRWFLSEKDRLKA